jgi:hypothetical protein
MLELGRRDQHAPAEPRDAELREYVLLEPVRSLVAEHEATLGAQRDVRRAQRRGGDV